MNSAIEILNHWGGSFLDFARAMFWQSSVLVLVLLALDFGLRHRVRAAVRHGLWLVLMVKLVLPTDLALPTSPAWWWSRATAVPVVEAPIVTRNYVVTQDDVLTPDVSAPDWVEPAPVRPALTLAAGSLLLAGVVSLGLLGWLLRRWWLVVRASQAAWPDAELAFRLGEARELTRLRSPVPVKLTRDTMSPAVCGLFRPVILLPQALAETLAPEQMRAVLLHELLHVRRGDVWVNLAQSLLQIVYWWHPLVWLANARIRRVREEAVDEAVMVALRGEADIYAPTLLAVAKFALHRPVVSLGLVGILESRSALRQRIERLVTLPVPRRAGLGVAGVLGIVAFSAVALPMGDAPPLPVQPAPEAAPVSTKPTSWPDPRFEGYRSVNLLAHFLILDQAQLQSAVPSLANLHGPLTISAADVDGVVSLLRAGGARFFNDFPGGVAQGGISGARMHYVIGGGTNTSGTTDCQTTNVGGRNLITGFEMTMPATQPDWTPMELTLHPLLGDSFTRSDMALTVGGQAQTAQPVQVVIPSGGAVAWAVPTPAQPGKCQVMLVMSWDVTSPTDALPFLKRTFPVPVPALPAAWSARGWSTNDDHDPSSMFYDFIYDAGLNWLPPRSFTYTNDWLEVRAPAGDVAVIATLVAKINHFSPAMAQVSAPATVPSANPPPLVSYILLGETGLPKLRQETGLTADRPAADYLAAFNKLLGASGHALPTNSLWLGDQGILLVRGEPAELDALGQLFRRLNGFPPPDTNRTTTVPEPASVSSLATASPGRPAPVATNAPDINQMMIDAMTLYESGQGDAARLKLAQVLRLDPANPAALYYMRLVHARPPAPAAAAVSSTNALLGAPFFRLTPLPATNNTALGLNWYGSPFGSNPPPSKLSPATITGILSNPNFQVAIHALQQRSGVEKLAEPEVTTTSGRQAQMRGSVMAENLIDAPMLDVPVHNRPQLHIKTYFIEVIGDVTNPPALAHPPTGPNEVAIVAGDLVHPWLHQLERRPGTEVLGEPEVTTTAGRHTQMRATTIMSVLTGVNPKALTPPGMTRAEVKTNGYGFFMVEQEELGPIFDVVPQVMADGYTINMRISATAVKFVGYDKPTEKVRVYVDDLPTNGPPAITTVPAPRFTMPEFRASVNLYDGQALIFTQPIDPRTGEPFEKTGKKARHLLVVATISLVDAAGNRVHTDEEMPFAHDHVPPPPIEPGTPLDDRPFKLPPVHF